MISEPATPVADGQRIGARRALARRGARGLGGVKAAYHGEVFVDNMRLTRRMNPSYGNA